MKESHKRSIAKGISWRFNATLITTVISYLVTGKIETALSIGAIEFIVKVFWYYVHERIWLSIEWGTHRHAAEEAI